MSKSYKVETYELLMENGDYFNVCVTDINQISDEVRRYYGCDMRYVITTYDYEFFHPWDWEEVI